MGAEPEAASTAPLTLETGCWLLLGLATATFLTASSASTGSGFQGPSAACPAAPSANSAALLEAAPPPLMLLASAYAPLLLDGLGGLVDLLPVLSPDGRRDRRPPALSSAAGEAGALKDIAPAVAAAAWAPADAPPSAHSAADNSCHRCALRAGVASLDALRRTASACCSSCASTIVSSGFDDAVSLQLGSISTPGSAGGGSCTAARATPGFWPSSRCSQQCAMTSACHRRMGTAARPSLGAVPLPLAWATSGGNGLAAPPVAGGGSTSTPRAASWRASAARAA